MGKTSAFGTKTRMECTRYGVPTIFFRRINHLSLIPAGVKSRSGMDQSVLDVLFGWLLTINSKLMPFVIDGVIVILVVIGVPTNLKAFYMSSVIVPVQ